MSAAAIQPAASTAAGPNQQAGRPPEPGEPTPPDRIAGRPLALVVEDNTLNRRLFGEVLRLAGFVVIEAVDGPAGLAAARRHRPDLIVMDVDLPGMSGLAAVGELRADPALAAVPVVAVSAHVDPGTARGARALGCSFLAKPVRPDALTAAAAAMLGRREAAPPPAGGR